MAHDNGGFRMAELSRQTGVSVPTIKYYLREGLLAPGEATSANQALYSREHVERIRLVRSLSKVAKLPLATIAEVLQIVDDGNVMEAMGRTQNVLIGEMSEGGSDDEGFAEVKELLDSEIAKMGWHVRRDSRAYSMALRALQELHVENLSPPVKHLADYVAAADKVGEADISTLADASSAPDMVRRMATGTTLRGPLTDAFIWLAQQHHAGKTYGGGQ